MYLDSNVFIFAILEDGKKGKAARTILKQIIIGKKKASTCALTIDEITYKIQKHTKNRPYAIAKAKSLIKLDNLKIIPVDLELVLASLNIMQEYHKLDPRDAIHLAAASEVGAKIIVSDDSDFDKIKGVTRQALI